MSKVRRYIVSCRLLKTCTVWTLLKTLGLGDMALFASHDDWRLGSFSTKYTPMVLDTISIINYTLPSTIRAVISTLTCTSMASNSISDSECY